MQAAKSKPLVICHVTESAPPCLKQAKETLRRIPNVEVHEIADLSEVAALLAGDRFAIIIVSISEAQDVKTLFEFLATIQKQTHAGSIRVLALSKIMHAKLTERLKGQGCSQILNFSINNKALFNKATDELDVLDRNRRKLIPRGAQAPKAPPKSGSDEEKKSEKSPKARAIEWITPILEDWDCWLVENQASEVKYVMGTWLIELLGPGPSAGSWKQVEQQNPQAAPQAADEHEWEWVPRNAADDPFVRNEGRWVFRGRQPEFVWKQNHWRMVSKNPSLTFHPKQGEPAFRFHVNKQQNLEICKNSSAANEKRPMIMASLESSITLKPEEAAKKKDDEPVYIDAKRDDDKPDWKQHDLKKSKDRDWNVHKDSSGERKAGWNDKVSPDDKERPDWNSNLNDSPDENPDWSGLDTKKDNVFNHGRGMGQGQRKDGSGYSYEEEAYREREPVVDSRWKTGAAAFASIEIILSISWPGHADDKPTQDIHILEINGTEMLLEIPSRQLAPGQTANFEMRVKTTEGKRTGLVSPIQVADVVLAEADRTVFRASVPPKAARIFQQIMGMAGKRQDEILEFFKEVKG